MEGKKKKKWDGHMMEMDVERLVNISRGSIPPGRRCTERPKEDGAT